MSERGKHWAGENRELDELLGRQTWLLLQTARATLGGERPACTIIITNSKGRPVRHLPGGQLVQCNGACVSSSDGVLEGPRFAVMSTCCVALPLTIRDRRLWQVTLTTASQD
jgi:hypothetical protein